MIGRAFLVACVVAALVASASAAGAATLDVRTGLWEMTSVGESSGMPVIPPEVLARMPPEQRAQIQASMAAAMGSNGTPQVNRSCITERTLQRGLDFGRREREHCRRTIVSSSSRHLDVRMECSGEEASTGTFRIETMDRQTVRGSLDMLMGNGGRTMTMKRNLQGRWLSSDCGNVKPVEE